MFEKGMRIYDSKYKRYGVIESVMYSKLRMDNMYTIAYDDKKWGKYFGKHMFERFSPIAPSYDNVVFVDFKTRKIQNEKVSNNKETAKSN